MELKPCPFCGKQPCLKESNGYSKMQIFCHCPPDPLVVDDGGETREAVIEKWNTRAHPAPSADLGKAIELLREVYDAYIFSTAQNHDFDWVNWGDRAEAALASLPKPLEGK